MRLPAVLGFAIAAVVSLPAAAAVNAPTGRIAFSMGGQTHEDIYVVNADGGGLFRLTDDPAADFDPSWSPDGRRIAYRHEDERSGQIYVMNADGSGQQNLTRRRGLDYSPAWSPDGKRIAFGSVRNGRATIWVMRTDGSRRKQLSRVYSEYPAWPPDGKKIAFDHISGSDWDIWVMNADGSGARPLIATAASEQGPAWSQEGKTIAYESDRGSSSSAPRIWLAGADGKRRHLLTGQLGERPVWSGGDVLFTAFEIVVVRRNGGAVTSIRVPGQPTLADWTR